MKRSEINVIIEDALKYMQDRSFYLPVWAYWTVDEWVHNKVHCSEIFSVGAGWDVSDSGGDFEKNGLVLFTIRNGILGQKTRQYCEKIIIMHEGQICPYHYHKMKTEDIINRGKGNLAFKLAKADGEDLSDQNVSVFIDGMHKVVRACEELILVPGQSITLYPYDYHMFYPLEGTMLIGEVSTVNNDKEDNFFLNSVKRFPDIEEDEPMRYPLVSDYAHL